MPDSLRYCHKLLSSILVNLHTNFFIAAIYGIIFLYDLIEIFCYYSPSLYFLHSVWLNRILIIYHLNTIFYWDSAIAVNYFSSFKLNMITHCFVFCSNQYGMVNQLRLITDYNAINRLTAFSYSNQNIIVNMGNNFRR